MGSPLGSLLANIFMAELEIVNIISLENFLQNWKRFVDETFAFILPHKIGYMLNQLNLFKENIQFTFEMKEENKLAFLDIMVISNTNGTINTTAYQKSTNIHIYINWHIHFPLRWKETAANVLIQRTIRICSNKMLTDEDLDIIKYNLCDVNNYPRKIMQNISNYNLHTIERV